MRAAARPRRGARTRERLQRGLELGHAARGVQRQPVLGLAVLDDHARHRDARVGAVCSERNRQGRARALAPVRRVMAAAAAAAAAAADDDERHGVFVRVSSRPSCPRVFPFRHAAHAPPRKTGPALVMEGERAGRRVAAALMRPARAAQRGRGGPPWDGASSHGRVCRKPPSLEAPPSRRELTRHHRPPSAHTTTHTVRVQPQSRARSARRRARRRAPTPARAPPPAAPAPPWTT